MIAYALFVAGMLYRGAGMPKLNDKVLQLRARDIGRLAQGETINMYTSKTDFVEIKLSEKAKKRFDRAFYNVKVLFSQSGTRS